jgi:hypothetical protein
MILEIGAGDLPAPPFKLAVGTVIDSAKFLERLQDDARKGDSSPRAKYGALQQDIRETLAICNSENIRNGRNPQF